MGSVYSRGNSWVGQYNDRGRLRQKTLGKRGVIPKHQQGKCLER
jgi:hypothetical protein